MDEKEYLRSLQAVDIRTIKRESLTDIADVIIHEELSQKERTMDYLNQIKNPYCYLDHGIIVKISFGNRGTMQECIEHYITNHCE